MAPTSTSTTRSAASSTTSSAGFRVWGTSSRSTGWPLPSNRPTAGALARFSSSRRRPKKPRRRSPPKARRRRRSREAVEPQGGEAAPGDDEDQPETGEHVRHVLLFLLRADF